MRLPKIFGALMLAVTLASCHHTSSPDYLPRNYSQLNTVIAPWEKDNDLLPWVRQGYVMIINSVEDIYRTQTPRFIEENPNWLNVDFETKTIIAVRDFLSGFDYWSECAVVGFALYVGDDNPPMQHGYYALDVVERYRPYDKTDIENDKSQYRICQFAIVTDKIPSDAKIMVWVSNDKRDPTPW